jgi:hypothetical protein
MWRGGWEVFARLVVHQHRDLFTCDANCAWRWFFLAVETVVASRVAAESPLNFVEFSRIEVRACFEKLCAFRDLEQRWFVPERGHVAPRVQLRLEDCVCRRRSGRAVCAQVVAGLGGSDQDRELAVENPR